MIGVSGGWKIVTVAAAGVVGVGGVVALSGHGPSGGGTTITCNQTAANSSQLTTATTNVVSGGTVCLTAAVDYGTYTGSGSNKTMTVIAQNGTGPASPVDAQIGLDLTNGDSGLTVDGNRATWGATSGLRIYAAAISGTPGPDVTIKNSLVKENAYNGSGEIFITGPTTARIVIQHNNFTDGGRFSSGGSPPAGTEAAIREDSGNNTLIDGNIFHDQWQDGIKYANSGVVISRNKFMNISDFPPWDATCTLGSGGCVHSDAIQSASSGVDIVGNWVKSCQQGLTEFDTDGGSTPSGSPTYEHNVIQGCAGHSLTHMMSASPGFTAKFNTIVDGPSFDCSTSPAKLSQYPSSPTATPTLYDNAFISGITLADGGRNCVPARNDHNMCSGGCGSGTSGISGTPTYVGGATPSSFTSFSDFCFTAASTGYTGADDGGQVGACGGGFDPTASGPPAGEGL